MDGVERADRVAGERLPRAFDDLFRDPQHVPVGRSRGKVRAAVGGIGLGEFVERQCPQQDTVALDQRQVGRDDEVGLAEQAAHRGRGRFVEQPFEHRARFRVGIHRAPRSSSSSSATLRPRLPGPPAWGGKAG